MKKKTIWMFVALAVVMLLALCLYMLRTNQAAQGFKTITADVVFEDGSQHHYVIKTKAETLREALEAHKLITGEESAYGLFITGVDGVEADESKQQWWCILKNGEQLNNGAETEMIADGDSYTLELRTGY